ncbi:basic secretory protein-like protein [Pedobacter sandarakinus]|uniref:basic secretory protein-like protein n=1 Tax=Pedobacter sandarakinus TaxID=353156 RepID=UPI0022477744|nr:basic secretory protein-like protein [Pedobacter sandarakinus]MCX2573064.1 basic secretory protein-like protein [Pedobacter sandarakinus]
MKNSILMLSLFGLLVHFKAGAEQEQLIKRGKYSLSFVNNSPLVTNKLQQDIANTFFKVYPEMVAEYNPKASKKVTIAIDTNYQGVAISGNNKITLSGKWMEMHPEDTDLVTHELFHIAQNFSGTGPEWLVEGLADCARFKYGLNNAPASWTLPPVASWQSYKQGYRVAARFLLWVDKYQTPNTIELLNAKLKSNNYNAAFWEETTGKTLDNLWELYVQNKDVD